MKPFSSQWPPVMPIACAAVCMRGPITQPSLIALRIAMSSKFGAPTLRIDVKPAISVLRTLRDAEDRAERVDVADGGVVAGRIAERAADDVRVRVDEAGQQRRVAEIDGARAGRNR